MKFFLFLLSFLLGSLLVRADVFTVTNNLNSGAGSLRSAMIASNTNGFGVVDYINFNIPDTSIAGRTITLLSALPAVGSNLIIDGSTQTGSNISVSTAKITLYIPAHIGVSSTMLHIQSGDNVQIYGLYFKVAAVDYIDVDYGILLQNCTNIIIGAPNKGNFFNNGANAIDNTYWSDITWGTISNIKIQSNIFGALTTTVLSGGDIDLKNCKGVYIGGPDSLERNIFGGSSIRLFQSFEANPPFFANIENNWLGYDPTNNNNNSLVGSINIIGNDLDTATLQPKLIIKNNQIKGLTNNGGLSIDQTSMTTKVIGNRFGTNLNPNPNWECYGYINVWLLGRNIQYGGHNPGDENTNSFELWIAPVGVHVIKNNIGVSFKTNVGPVGPQVKVDTYNNGLITGTSDPGSKIQLYSKACISNCLKIRYFATTVADATGKWSYPYTAAMPSLLATSTRPSDSSTSAITLPEYDNSNYIVQHATCGKSNGSVTNMKIVYGTHIGWYNSANQLISTDTNLINVPTGSYQLRVSIGALGCVTGITVNIMDLSPPPIADVQITPAACGQSNGQLYYSNGIPSLKWLNSNLDSIGTGAYLSNVAPGNYYLKIWMTTDTSCNKTYGPFLVNNLSGPSFNVSGLQILPATCGNTNGSISGITINNMQDSPFMIWVDSLGNSYGNSLNINSLPSGKYRLKYKDDAQCDTIITPYFNIENLGVVNVNISNLVVVKSNCGSSVGSISQINVTGATSFQWYNSFGQVVGSAVNLNAIPAGTYILKVTNNFGCQATSDSIIVLDNPFVQSGNIQVNTKAGTCGNINGFIEVLNFPNPTFYTYRWVNNSQPNTTISTQLNLYNINYGTFILYAKNTGGCEQEIINNTIQPLIPVSIDESKIIVRDETCDNKNGSIKGIQILAGASPYQYKWIDTDYNVVATTLDLNGISNNNLKLIVVDANGCTDTSLHIKVDNVQQLLAAPNYSNQSILKGTGAQLTILNQVTNGTYYLYESALATVPIANNTTGNFSVPVQYENKTWFIKLVKGVCESAIVPVEISVFDKSEVYVPSAFTPNGDGKNDNLKPIVFGNLQSFEFSVYNRYSHLIFKTTDPTKGWDGSVKGVKQEIGNYVWICSYRLNNEKQKIEKGSCILIR